VRAGPAAVTPRRGHRAHAGPIAAQEASPIPRRAGVGSMSSHIGLQRQINDAVVFIGWTLRVKSEPQRPPIMHDVTIFPICCGSAQLRSDRGSV
jgi:hypothetical protein